MSSSAENDAGSRVGATAQPGTVAPGRPEASGSSVHRVRHRAIHEDRWHWRRKIRQDPRKLAIYRLVVAVVGGLLIVLGFLTGWLPGPGGIPLVLLGLAILASEFSWAHRLMEYFKRQLHRFTAWPRWKQVLFWVAFVGCVALLIYAYMAAAGVPTWLPDAVRSALVRLPGL
jgi:uncharacterized protein (TIGR02611 family)